jgi:hypothetical protein
MDESRHHCRECPTITIYHSSLILWVPQGIGILERTAFDMYGDLCDYVKRDVMELPYQRQKRDREWTGRQDRKGRTALGLGR